MNPPDLLAWSWQPRDPVPEPGAAIAWGDAAVQLLARLNQLPDPRRARLHVTANADALVVLGASADLPWVDGVDYAAPSTEPALWLPTRWQPDLPLDLVSLALQARHARKPMLLWRAPAACIPLDRQLPVNAELLDRIDAFWCGR